MARAGGLPQPTITDDRALGGAVIERSLRFHDVDTAYLSRTPGSAGNRKTYTISAWVKLSSLESTTRPIFTRYTANDESGFLGLYVNSDNYIYFTGWTTVYLKSSRIYRDSTGWLHIVCAVDTTQSTSTDRIKLYINGELEPTATYNAPSQNADLIINEASAEHMIGRYHNVYFDGYMAEMNFIDGQQLDSSYFGYTEGQTGIWRPKRYEGSYGTNGFHLDFSDNSSTTTLGIDKSPNGNDWSLNNFSVSAGIDNDSFTNTPTSENVFAQLNSALPLASGAEYRNGNYAFYITNNGAHMRASSDMSVNSGKWYAEFKLSSYTFASGSYPYIGVCAEDLWLNSWAGDTGTAYQTGGTIWRNGSSISSGHATYTAGDTISIAIDLDQATPKIWWAKNGTYINSGNPATNTNGTDIAPTSNTGYYNYALSLWAATGGQWDANFGQRAFSYDIPSGFKTLCTDNIRSNENIVRAQKHFDILTYTGTATGSGTQTISDLQFAPDFVWIKSRAIGYSHLAVDTVRGASKGLLTEDDNTEETTNVYGMVTSFGNNGFTMTRGSNDGGKCCENTQTYVAWCWKGGGAAVANSDGDISSSVSVNEEAGFSIVSYTGDGNVNSTVGHGLNGNPDFILIKNRDAEWWWRVYHSYYGTTATQGLFFNENNASYTHDNHGGIKAITSTTFGFGTNGTNTLSGVNKSADKYIAYCWKEIPGYSKFGSYNGNGLANGTYVHLGFRPAWLMIKNTAAGNSWTIMDTKRDVDNPTGLQLFANLSDADYSATGVDFTSNGFKCRNSAAEINNNPQTYIYMAFAEQTVLKEFDQVNPNAR